MAGYTPPEIVQEVIRKYDEAKGHHAQFVKAYERRERSYQGLLSASSDAAKWRHKLHPKYAFNLIETMVANTIEEGLKISARPSPHARMTLEEAQAMVDKGETVEQLLRHQHRVDDMDAKQRPLYLSEAIGGIGVGKTYWNYTEGSVRRQGVVEEEVFTDDGTYLGTVPTVREIHENGVLRDHSTFEVVDPRDFIFHESAKTLQPTDPGGAQHVFHRCWYSYEQLKMMEAAKYIKNVDVLKESLDFSDEYRDRETTLWNVNRTKDLIEVLEYWCFRDGQVYRTLVGNRVILLRDEEASPFWHGQYPFVIANSMPQLFSMRGMSGVELVEQLQEIIWELTNQRLDNVELINNAIMLIRSDVDDPEAFEYYPGAHWPVDDTAQVEALQPPYQLAELTLSAESLAKGDLQNVTSAAPLASGAQTATVDQKTATGASLIMSAAQRALQARKYQAQHGLKREAWQRLKNCQQFLDGNQLIHILGEDGSLTFKEISTMDIQGEFLLELAPMSESLMRQEKRAEALQFGQVLGQMAPLAAASGQIINVHEVVKWMAEKWEIADVERFFAPPPNPGGMAAMMGPGGGGAGAPPGAGGPGQPEGPNMGITADSAVDASSPSATGGNSLSPEMMMQRALSMTPGNA